MTFSFSALFFILVGTCLSHPQYQDPATGGIQEINQCGHSSYGCVPYFQCVDGKINTDGSGLIDVRTRPQGTCTNPDYPDVPAVCCLIPEGIPTPTPIESCPQYQECVEYRQCGADGVIVSDGSGLIDIRTQHISCWLPNGIGGRCCNPPPVIVESCPAGSICTLEADCHGQALDASNHFHDYISSGLWSHCPHGSVHGICCKQPLLDVCPQNSVCLPGDKCEGTALAEGGSFADYVPTGSWSHCSEYDLGICCINPTHDSIFRPADHCGVRNEQIDQRITGGTLYDKTREAAFGEFPWQAIIFYQNYTYKCGASLISHKHVLTAAHCVHGLYAADIRVRFGEWQVNTFDEKLPYVDRNVHAIHIHPDFTPKNVHNDVAVIELVEPIQFNYHINTICLPSIGQYFDPGKRCIATGWGKDSFEKGTFQHILKKIDLPYVDHSTCQNLLRKTRLGKFFQLDDSFICAGGEVNKDACYGDGGGPLVCQDQISDRYVLIGITAWGIGCGTKDVPGVYANVEKFVSWIDGYVLAGGKQGSVPGYGK